MFRFLAFVYYVLELIIFLLLKLTNLLPFNLNFLMRILGRNTKDRNSTCVDSALEKLTKEFKFGHEPEWISIRVGLELIQTFLTFVPKWRDTDEVVREHLGDLVSSIVDAFEMAGMEIGSAIKKEDSELMDAVRSSLLEKIELFKPIIREAYDFSSEYAFQIQTSAALPPIRESETWNQLCVRLHNNASSLKSEGRLGSPLCMQFEQIVTALKAFGNVYLKHTSDPTQFWGFVSLIEGGAICLARLLFLWWVDEMDEDNKTTMFLDLMQRIKPTSPPFLGMYVKAIGNDCFSPRPNVYLRGMVCDPWHFARRNKLAHKLVTVFLIPSKKSLETFHDGLLTLIIYLVDSVDFKAKDDKLLRSDIEKAICDLASLNFFSHQDEELMLFQWLPKIELLKLEAKMILEKGWSVSKGTFVDIRKGLRFLQTFLEVDVNSEELMLIFKRIEQVAMEVESLHFLLWESGYGEKWHHYAHALKSKLFLDFKLLKIEAFVMMAQTGCAPSLMIIVEDKIHSLNEGLELLHKNFSLLPLENQGDEEPILTCIDRLAKEETPLYSFLQSNQITEHTINEMSLLLTNFLEKVNLLNSEIQGTFLQFRSSSVLPFPRTHLGLGFVDLFLEKLRELMERKINSIGYPIKDQIEAVLRELDSLRSFLEEVGERRNENPDLKDLRRRITRAAYEADYIIDWIVLVKCDWSHVLWLSNVIDEMKAIKSDLTKIVQMKNDFPDVHHVVQTSEQMITQTAAQEIGQVVVSLDDQEEIIINRLKRGTSNREVVTIFGMPGIGKTTLAKKVYDSSQVKNHFQRLAWCSISQVYRKRELLLKILSDIDIVGTNNEICDKSDEDLIEMMRKGLKGRRYLVVMDDVWDTQAWTELGTAFPDDSKGSRILFTSRFEKVGLEAQRDSLCHPLRFLEEGESWKLLQERVFDEDRCPEELVEVGRTIAKCCKGLPLAVVAVAGILKRTERKDEQWKELKDDLESRILEDPENQCMHILELSYNHLPDDLKPCFLYFAAFGEDNEVPVQKLIQLWIAEGFVRKIDQKASLEDVAESYIMDLIGRSLLMAARRGSDGRVKACKVHDMLYNLCLRKVEEDKFLQYINGYEKLFPFSNNRLDYGLDSDYPPNSVAYEQHRLSICSKRKHFVMLKPSGPSVRTLLFSATSDTYARCPYDGVLLFITDKFKILKVLDIESINIGSSFPERIALLEALRYLAISGNIKSVPSAIEKLWNLETFIVKGLLGKVELPETIWSMSRLRHLHVSTQAIFSLQDGSLERSSEMDNLVSLSWPVLSQGDGSEEMMKLFPKLQKLRCTFSEPAQHSDKSIRFPVLNFLKELVSLKIIYNGSVHHYCQFKGLSFPLNLKKLSLSDFSLTWDEFSAIGGIPKLKVLKLVSIAFDSPTWDMKDDEFQELEYLKVDSLKIVDWNASRDPLPVLQQLVLRNCSRLQEVPLEFGYINTLQMIEVKWCSGSAEKSVREIQEQQLEYGNTGFKVFINVAPADFRSSV